MQTNETHIYKTFFAAAALGLGLLLAAPAWAQESDIPAPTASTDNVAVARKNRSFLHKAKKPSPAEQLAYAESLRLAGKTKKAAKAYRALVHAYHESPEAPQAQRMYAQLLLEKGKHYAAFEEFQYLVKFYSGDFTYEEILMAQFKIANLIRTENEKGMAFMGASTAKSLPLYRKIIKNAPNWERAPEAQFFMGAVHEDRKEYTDAIEAYESVMMRYPKSAFVANATYQRANCLYAISSSSPRDEKRGQEALSALVSFLRDYPSDPNADSARESRDDLTARLGEMFYSRATYYDTVVKKPKAAIIAYNDFLNRFPASDRHEEVQKRVTALQQIEELEKSE